MRVGNCRTTLETWNSGNSTAAWTGEKAEEEPEIENVEAAVGNGASELTAPCLALPFLPVISVLPPLSLLQPEIKMLKFPDF